MSFNLGFIPGELLSKSAEYKKIHPEEETVQYAFPWYENHQTHPTTIPEAFVVTLQGGATFTEESGQAVATSSGKLISDLSGAWKIPPERHPILDRKEFPPLHFVDQKVAMLCTVGASNNYYHWMIDLLPRIDLIRKSGLQPDTYYLPRPRFSYQNETLQKLGIEEKRCIYSDDFPYIKAKELIVPSIAAPPFKVPIPHWAIDFLRNEFLPGDILEPTELLYISREKATTRRVVNEAEIMKFLASKGFKKVVLENVTVAEQAKLFASARTIISVHGAALINLVFCSKATKVIEIFHPDFILHCYFSLCNQMALPYVTQMATPAGKEGDFDVHVALDELEELIKE